MFVMFSNSCLKQSVDCTLLALPSGWHCVLQAKANVCNVQGAKIELKKMCGGKNKKYRGVDNECRLTRCPFEIWSLCWSPVKMVYFFSV